MFNFVLLTALSSDWWVMWSILLVYSFHCHLTDKWYEPSYECTHSTVIWLTSDMILHMSALISLSSDAQMTLSFIWVHSLHCHLTDKWSDYSYECTHFTVIWLTSDLTVLMSEKGNLTKNTHLSFTHTVTSLAFTHVSTHFTCIWVTSDLTNHVSLFYSHITLSDSD